MSDVLDITTATEHESVEKVEDAPKRKFTFNEADMTLADLEEFEDITGKSWGQVMKRVPVRDDEGRIVPDPDPAARGGPLMEVQMSMRAMVALLYLNLRRENPETTLDDVRRMKLSEFEIEMEETVKKDPLPPTAS